MESLQAMKLSKLNETNMYSSSPPKSTSAKERASSSKSKPSKLVEKAFVNLFVHEIPRKRTNSTAKPQKKKRQSFEMSDLTIKTVNPAKQRFSEIPLQFEDYNRSDETTDTFNESEAQSEEQLANVECPCSNQHPGKEQLNIVLSNLNIYQVFDAFFSESKFLAENWRIRKLFDIKLNEWDGEDRQLEYSIDLGPLKPKSFEYQKILTNKPNECIVVESTVKSQNVLYCDYFSVINRYCMTRHESNSCRLIVSNHIHYYKTPNFIAKGFIERNCNSTLKEYYDYITINLPKYDAPPAKTNLLNKSNSNNDKTYSSSPHLNKVNKARPTSKVHKDSRDNDNTIQDTIYIRTANTKQYSDQEKQQIYKTSKQFNLNMKYEVIFFILFFLIFVSIILDIGMFLKLNEAESIINKYITPVQQQSELNIKNLIQISLERVKKIESKFIEYGNVFEN